MMEREQPGRKHKRPEDWLGRPVKLVFISGSSTEYIDGILEEVNDRGIVLSSEVHVGRPAQSLFYPWSAMVQLTVAHEDRKGGTSCP
jgi:hypothetical protein